MSVLAVDPVALARVGGSIRTLRGQAEISAGVVRAVSGQWGDAIPALSAAAMARRMEDVLTRVGALADVIAVVAEGFARTESGVAASFAAVTDAGDRR